MSGRGKRSEVSGLNDQTSEPSTLVDDENPYLSPTATEEPFDPPLDEPPKLTRRQTYGLASLAFVASLIAWLLVFCGLSVYYGEDPTAPFTQPNARDHFLRGLIPALFMGVVSAVGIVVGVSRQHTRSIARYRQQRLSKELSK